jgi:quercetin dioxygenase-like cupin family protein
MNSYHRLVIFRSKRFGQAVLIAVRRNNYTPIHNHSLPVTGCVLLGSPHEVTQSGRHDLRFGDVFKQPVGGTHQVGNDKSRIAVILDLYPPGALHMEKFPTFPENLSPAS